MRNAASRINRANPSSSAALFQKCFGFSANGEGWFAKIPRGLGGLPGNLNACQTSLPELYSPIPYIVPAQMFAAALAMEKGLDPDKPRTLSKVTRTL